MADPVSESQVRTFLGVYFTRCHVYGRFYKNAAGNAYEGYCPKCRAKFSVKIGAEGTDTRFFKAHCPPGGGNRWF